jgi:hypothetical protein
MNSSNTGHTGSFENFVWILEVRRKCQLPYAKFDVHGTVRRDIFHVTVHRDIFHMTVHRDIFYVTVHYDISCDRAS